MYSLCTMRPAEMAPHKFAGQTFWKNFKIFTYSSPTHCIFFLQFHVAVTSSMFKYAIATNVNSVVIVIVVVSSCAVGLKQLRLLLLLLQLCLLCCLLYSLPLLLLELLLLQSGLKQHPVVRAEQFTNPKTTDAFHGKRLTNLYFLWKI